MKSCAAYNGGGDQIKCIEPQVVLFSDNHYHTHTHTHTLPYTPFLNECRVVCEGVCVCV